MLYYNLKPIFAARQIDKPYTFLVKIGLSSQTAHKILNDNCHVVRLDNLELMCKALYCDPNELLAYKPNKTEQLPETHPLNKLIPHTTDDNWEQQIRTLPIAKLRELLTNANQQEDKT